MYSLARLDPGNLSWIVLLDWYLIRGRITGAHYINYWMDRQETWILFPNQVWTFWKATYTSSGLYFPVIMLFGKWFEGFRWEILMYNTCRVIKVGLMTTSFSLKGFPWGQRHPWRLFCSISLVLLPYELLEDGLQLLVYHYKPVLRLVYLNTGENPTTAVNFLITYALYIAK